MSWTVVKSMQDHPVTPGHPGKQPKEMLSLRVFPENDLTLEPVRHHVIPASRVIMSKLTCHDLLKVS